MLTNTTTLDDAVAQLESGLKNVPGIRAAAGRVTLAQTQVTVSLADIGKAIRPESVSTAADDLKRQCHAFLDSLLKQRQDALRSVLDELPLSSIEGEIARAIPQAAQVSAQTRSGAFDAILGGISDPGDRARTLDQLASMSLGS